MSEFAGLLERVKAATGKDRELDGDLLLGLGVYPIEAQSSWRSPPYAPIREWASRQALPYTASIDAALTLVAKTLPGANTWGIERDPKGSFFLGWVGRNNVPSGHWLKEADHTTAPLAILAALLAALIARETAS